MDCFYRTPWNPINIWQYSIQPKVLTLLGPASADTTAVSASLSLSSLWLPALPGTHCCGREIGASLQSELHCSL